MVASLSDAPVVIATTATRDVEWLRTLDTVAVKDADYCHITLTLLTDKVCNISEGPKLETRNQMYT